MALKFALVVLLAAASANAQIIFGTGGSPQPMKAPAVNTAPEQRCVVQGKAVNALTGEPLKKVSVRLVRVNSKAAAPGSMPEMEGYSDTSAADGSFKIDGIEPGEYFLSGERAGYLHSAYGATSRFSQGTRLTLSAAQQLTGLSLTMTPQSVIAGRVVDQDGDPVGNTMVMALQQMWNNGRANYFPTSNAQADEDGRFRLSNLQPGKYYVVAQTGFNGMSNPAPASPGKPDMRPVPTFYPDATTRENATPVAVRPGETSPDLEIHMQFQAGHHVRGKVVAPLPGSSDDLHLNIVPEGSDFPFGFNFDPRSSIKADRTFDVSGVTPGRYSLMVLKFGGNLRAVAETEIEVGDSDLNGVDLLPITLGTLHGQIAMQGTAPAGAPTASLKQVRVHLQPSDMRHIMFGGAEQSETSDTGAFGIQNVAPGKYDIAVENVPKGAYVQSVTYGSQEVAHKTLDLTAGVGGEMQVTLRYGVAEVDGTVSAADNSGDATRKPNALVYLFPEDAADTRLYSSEPDQNAAFSEKDLPPGTYHVIAAEGIGPMSLGNPDLRKELASRGVEVDLKENDKKQIQLNVLSAADVQQIYARLGIEPE